MRISKKGRYIFGPIFSVLAISMVFLSCQKEDIDELIILEEGEYETITLVTEPCGMTVDISSSPDDGTGIGMLESSAIGGIGPYSYAWYRSGSLVGLEPSLTALDFGIYQLIVYDSEGCSTAEMAEVELNLSGWDCPELLGDVGDACSLDGSTEGLITANCECATNTDCSISLTFLSSAADDGSGSGFASIYIAGGQGPYAWTLLSPGWQALQVGTFLGSDGIMDFNGLSSGFFAVEFLDSQGCLAQIFINIP